MADDQLTAHLEYFEELGAEGISRDPAWRTRPNPQPPLAPTTKLSFAPTTEPGLAPTIETGIAPTTEVGIAPTTEVGLAPTLIPDRTHPLVAIQTDIGPDCSRCKLHALGRTQVVFGVGNPNAELMFVGEAPGADEDIKGEPFVGRAGQLLTKIIEAIDLTREQVYIANVIKCRPPGNRNPEPDEVEQCEPFLFRQIDAIKPKVIVALGKFAAQCLLKTETPISKLRGQEFAYRDAILIPTFHPAYLLRNPGSKREVWEDMKKVRAILNRP